MRNSTALANVAGATSRSGEIRPLNAFELINAALDISSLFERRSDVVKRHTRFTSRESPSRIAEVVEAAHVQLGGLSERNSFRCSSKKYAIVCGFILNVGFAIRNSQLHIK